jgi:hypothetical protein
MPGGVAGQLPIVRTATVTVAAWPDRSSRPLQQPRSGAHEGREVASSCRHRAVVRDFIEQLRHGADGFAAKVVEKSRWDRLLLGSSMVQGTS